MRIRVTSPLWRRAVRTAARLAFRWVENNDDECIERNGERWLMRELLKHHVSTGVARPFVLFDAGANQGDYTRLALAEAAKSCCPIEVHAFEPSAFNQQVLRSAFAAHPEVRVVGVALSAQAGEALLHAGGSGSRHASLFARPVLRDVRGDATRVPTLTLHSYVAQQGVTKIDLLKLDVEGAETAALLGLGEKLTPDFVDAIQFEYGGAALDAGSSLRELHQLLVSRGFRFAKLFPRAVEVREFREWMENFAFGNYVALAPRWVRDHLRPRLE